LHDTRDPVEVPRDWFCHLNSGNCLQCIL
jgi:hypothetical protein